MYEAAQRPGIGVGLNNLFKGVQKAGKNIEKHQDRQAQKYIALAEEKITAHRRRGLGEAADAFLNADMIDPAKYSAQIEKVVDDSYALVLNDPSAPEAARKWARDNAALTKVNQKDGANAMVQSSWHQRVGKQVADFTENLRLGKDGLPRSEPLDMDELRDFLGPMTLEYEAVLALDDKGPAAEEFKTTAMANMKSALGVWVRESNTTLSGALLNYRTLLVQQEAAQYFTAFTDSSGLPGGSYAIAVEEWIAGDISDESLLAYETAIAEDRADAGERLTSTYMGLFSMAPKDMGLGLDADIARELVSHITDLSADAMGDKGHPFRTMIEDLPLAMVEAMGVSGNETGTLNTDFSVLDKSAGHLGDIIAILELGQGTSLFNGALLGEFQEAQLQASKLKKEITGFVEYCNKPDGGLTMEGARFIGRSKVSPAEGAALRAMIGESVEATMAGGSSDTQKAEKIATFFLGMATKSGFPQAASAYLQDAISSSLRTGGGAGNFRMYWLPVLYDMAVVRAEASGTETQGATSRGLAASGAVPHPIRPGVFTGELKDAYRLFRITVNENSTGKVPDSEELWGWWRDASIQAGEQQ